MNTIYRDVGALIRAALVTALLGVLAAAALAHGDEDHGALALAPAGSAMAPRAVAQTEDFELVGVLLGTTLTVTLDRFATNEPVADAQVEVESGSALKAVARQVTPGVYVVQSDLFATPGKYPLAFSVQAGESSDLLVATLDLTPAQTGAPPVRAGTEWAVWIGAGALLALAVGLIAVRRRSRASSTLQPLKRFE